MKLGLGLMLVCLAFVAQARTVWPRRGLIILCKDQVTLYNFVLEMRDLGTQEARIVVFDEKDQFLKRYDYLRQSAEIMQSKNSFAFVTRSDGKIEAVIEFHNYDMDRVTYADGGDSHPMKCEYP